MKLIALEIPDDPARLPGWLEEQLLSLDLAALAESHAVTGWGWSRPGALRQDLTASAYLKLLADEADEWLSKRPDQPAALTWHIAELRQGCSVLILGEHQPLSPEDRQWLVKICRQWATDLDKRLAEVESGERPVQVLERMDETVMEITRKLRDRAVRA